MGYPALLHFFHIIPLAEVIPMVLSETLSKRHEAHACKSTNERGNFQYEQPYIWFQLVAVFQCAAVSPHSPNVYRQDGQLERSSPPSE